MCKHKTADLQTPLIPESRFFAICKETIFFVFIHFTVCLVRIEL